jgi:hypothetical protein
MSSEKRSGNDRALDPLIRVDVYRKLLPLLSPPTEPTKRRIGF